jgi:hypothetical protein
VSGGCFQAPPRPHRYSSTALTHCRLSPL